MGVWRMGERGKRMGTMLREIPEWWWDQYQDWAGRAGGAAPSADWLRDYAIDEYNPLYTEGFGMPEQIRAWGQQIMPGVDEAMGRRGGRLGDIQAGLRGLPGAGATMADIDRSIDEYGGAVTRISGAAGGEIGDTYGRMTGAQEATHGDIVGSIGDTFGGARGGAQGLYGTLLGETDTVYGGLRGAGDETYGEMRRNIEKTSPAGDFAAARTARSFGPMMRSAMGRLRAAGVDPNSMEATSAMRGIEAERARGMDDQMASGMERYSDRMNQMLGSEQGMRERLGLGRLGFGSELAREGGAIDRNLLLGSGEAFRNALRENAAIGRGLETGRMGERLGQLDKDFGRTADYFGQRRGAALTGRELGLQDWGMDADVLREMNQEDLLKLNLMNQQFGMGADLRGQDLGFKTNILGRMEGASQQQIANQIAMQQMANQLGGMAYAGYGTGRETEAQKAGWLSKVLGGVGFRILDSYMPSMGPSSGAGVMNMGSGGSNAFGGNPAGNNTFGGPGQTSGWGYGGGGGGNAMAGYNPQPWQNWNMGYNPGFMQSNQQPQSNWNLGYTPSFMRP